MPRSMRYGLTAILGETRFLVLVFSFFGACSMNDSIIAQRNHSAGIARFPFSVRYAWYSACSLWGSSLFLFSSSCPLNLCIRIGVVPTILIFMGRFAPPFVLYIGSLVFPRFLGLRRRIGSFPFPLRCFRFHRFVRVSSGGFPGILAFQKFDA